MGDLRGDRFRLHANIVWEARNRIAPLVPRTPLVPSPFLSEVAGRPVYLKMENIHEINAFKIRGAANKILSLSTEERRRGVTTFSTGNHGLAVSAVARRLGIPAVICVSRRVPKVKTEAIRRRGAHLEIAGDSQDDAEIRCRQLQEERGLTVVKPFDDPLVIAGQGTIGLELLEDLPEVETVVIPLSGGGLLAGIALAVKANRPDARIVGVSTERSAVMIESLRRGHPVALEESETLADSLLGGIGLDNQYTFRMVRDLADATIQVSEEAIAEGMRWLLHYHRTVAEGAAATTVAALLEGKVPPGEGPVVLIISGGNVDPGVLLQIADHPPSHRGIDPHPIRER
ncbi:MAG: hydroxyectoine utilization dehydratase EutB [Planifilum fimeticola]|jgi:threonine dehydratase